MHLPQSSESSASAPETPTAAVNHRWGFGAFFLAEAVFVIVSVLLAVAVTPPRDGGEVGVGLLIALVLPTVLAGVVAVVISLLRGNGPRLDFGLRWRWSDITTGLGIGFAGLVVTTIATVLWSAWMGPEANSAVGSLLEGLRLPPLLAVLIFLHVWLLAPFCEELLYRGLLWGAMERLRWSRITALVLTTAIFAIGHLEPARTLLLVVIALPIGLARMVTGRLTASVVAHQVNNFLPALGLLLMSQGWLPA